MVKFDVAVRFFFGGIPSKKERVSGGEKSDGECLEICTNRDCCLHMLVHKIQGIHNEKENRKEL